MFALMSGLKKSLNKLSLIGGTITFPEVKLDWWNDNFLTTSPAEGSNDSIVNHEVTKFGLRVIICWSQMIDERQRQLNG